MASRMFWAWHSLACATSSSPLSEHAATCPSKVVAAAWLPAEPAPPAGDPGPGRGFAMVSWALDEEASRAAWAMPYWLQQGSADGQGCQSEVREGHADVREDGSQGQWTSLASGRTHSGRSDEQHDFIGMMEGSPSDDAPSPPATRRRQMAQTGETASSGQRPNPFQPAVARDMRESKQIRDMLKPEAFSGKPEDFPEFEESLVSFMATWGMETLLEHAATRGTCITLEEQCPSVREVGLILYQLLRKLCEGDSRSIVRLVNNMNGWEAWRLLKKQYAPDSGDRHVSILQGLLNPKHWKLTPLHKFWPLYTQWKHDVNTYEHDAQDQVTEATKVAVVKKFAPAAVQKLLRLTEVGKDFAKLDDKVQSILSTLITYNAFGIPIPASEDEDDSPQTTTPMAVDALMKGKGKGKAKFTTPGGLQPGTESNIECFRCHERGHIAADCKKNPSQSEHSGRCDFCEQFGHRQRQCPLWQKHNKIAMAQLKRQGSSAVVSADDQADFFGDDIDYSEYLASLLGQDALTEDQVDSFFEL